jgi:hypothetical protein
LEIATAGADGTVTGGGLYYTGDIVYVTAIPDSGHIFEGWYEDNIKIEGAGATYSFVADDFLILEARFD